MSRLFRRLGFTDAQEVRDQARASRSRGVPVGPTRASGGLAEHAEAERHNLDVMLSGLSDGRLERAAALVAGAERVVVAGFRNSYPVALHLRQQLVQARDDVRVAPQPGQSIGEELVGLGARDVVVLVGFRRRPAGFAGVLSSLAARGVPVVLVADPSLRGVDVTVRLDCPVETPAPVRQLRERDEPGRPAGRGGADRDRARRPARGWPQPRRRDHRAVRRAVRARMSLTSAHGADLTTSARVQSGLGRVGGTPGGRAAGRPARCLAGSPGRYVVGRKHRSRLERWG